MGFIVRNRGHMATGAFLGFVLPFAHGHAYLLGAIITAFMGSLVGLFGAWCLEWDAKHKAHPPYEWPE